MYIGRICVGAPFCADDTFLISLTEVGIQVMLSIVEKYASRERYTIHPQKSQYMALGGSGASLTLCDVDLPQSSSITHSGITRSRNGRGPLSIDDLILDRISITNRTIYALMGAGLHGINGLPPAVTLHMYLTYRYAVPRLLFGLESLILLQKHISQLSDFHRNVLRRLQSLPIRTAKPAIYLLLGSPPLEAILDRAIAGLLYSIGNRGNQLMYDLAIQQLTSKEHTSHSWFIYAQKRSSIYHVDAWDLVEQRRTLKETKFVITRHWETQPTRCPSGF